MPHSVLRHKTSFPPAGPRSGGALPPGSGARIDSSSGTDDKHASFHVNAAHDSDRQTRRKARRPGTPLRPRQRPLAKEDTPTHGGQSKQDFSNVSIREAQQENVCGQTNVYTSGESPSHQVPLKITSEVSWKDRMEARIAKLEHLNERRNQGTSIKSRAKAGVYSGSTARLAVEATGCVGLAPRGKRDEEAKDEVEEDISMEDDKERDESERLKNETPRGKMSGRSTSVRSRTGVSAVSFSEEKQVLIFSETSPFSAGSGITATSSRKSTGARSVRFAAESEVLGSNGKSFSEDEEQDEVVEEDAILGFADLAGEDAVAEEVMDEDIVQETSTRWHHGNGSRQALYDSVPGLGSAYRSIFQDVNEVEFGSRSILALSPDPDEWGYIQVIGDGDSDSDSESNLGVEDHLDVDPARRRSMYQKSDHKKDIDELMKLRSGLRFAREYRHSNVGERQGRRARGENKEVSKKSALVPTPRKPADVGRLASQAIEFVSQGIVQMRLPKYGIPRNMESAVRGIGGGVKVQAMGGDKQKKRAGEGVSYGKVNGRQSQQLWWPQHSKSVTLDRPFSPHRSVHKKEAQADQASSASHSSNVKDGSRRAGRYVSHEKRAVDARECLQLKRIVGRMSGLDDEGCIKVPDCPPSEDKDVKSKKGRWGKKSLPLLRRSKLPDQNVNRNSQKPTGKPVVPVIMSPISKSPLSGLSLMEGVQIRTRSPSRNENRKPSPTTIVAQKISSPINYSPLQEELDRHQIEEKEFERERKLFHKQIRMANQAHASAGIDKFHVSSKKSAKNLEDSSRENLQMERDRRSRTEDDGGRRKKEREEYRVLKVVKKDGMGDERDVALLPDWNNKQSSTCSSPLQRKWKQEDLDMLREGVRSPIGGWDAGGRSRGITPADGLTRLLPGVAQAV